MLRLYRASQDGRSRLVHVGFPLVRKRNAESVASSLSDVLTGSLALVRAGLRPRSAELGLIQSATEHRLNQRAPTSPSDVFVIATPGARGSMVVARSTASSHLCVTVVHTAMMRTSSSRVTLQRARCARSQYLRQDTALPHCFLTDRSAGRFITPCDL